MRAIAGIVGFKSFMKRTPILRTSKSRSPLYRQMDILFPNLLTKTFHSSGHHHCKQAHPKTWWKAGVIYQVYPRSFKDTTGDGVGDLAGITQKLDYLKWLGVDAIWLSPFYPSPMIDFGYDITDHCDVHPLFGTLDDFNRLLTASHKRGIKILVDYVPNHTSIDHPWFVESRSSKDNPKRDWYIWRDPAPDGGVPTNWQSVFGGSGWEFDKTTGQYFYHSYVNCQPDLNWRNPECRKAMLQVLKFWLEKGVDGFRIDALFQLIKDNQFRNNPTNPNWNDKMNDCDKYINIYSSDRPEVLDMIEEMRSVVDEYPDRLLIGELYVPINRLVTYYGSAGRGVHLPFNFHLILANWNVENIRKLIEEYELAVPDNCWPNWVLGNHDVHRIATRIGAPQARVAAMLLLSLRGTPTMYYGDEIGMHNVHIPPEKVVDPYEKNLPGRGFGRDPCRTPMQWNDDPGAGFTTGEPWLPLADDYKENNVEVEKRDPKSFLSLYKKLIDIRRSYDALIVGSYEKVPGTSGDLLAFMRTKDKVKILVVLNLGDKEQEFTPENSYSGHILLSTHLDIEGETVNVQTPFKVRPNEGIMVYLEESKF